MMKIYLIIAWLFVVAGQNTTSDTSKPSNSNSNTDDAKASKIKLRFISRFTQSNQEKNVEEGSNEEIDCRVKTEDGSPLVVPPKVTWFKDNKPLHATSFRHFPERGMEDVYILKLKNLLPADAGKYKCVADNGRNKAATYSLVVKVTENKDYSVPKIKEFTPRDTVIQVGQSIQFFCLAELTQGNLVDHTPFIQWVKRSTREVIISNEAKAPVNVTNITTTVMTTTATSTTATPDLTGTTLTTHRFTNDSYIVNDTIYETKTLKLVRGEESYLNIVNATFEDSGTYTCIIFNRKGYANKSSTLTVVPVPPLTLEEREKLYFQKYGSTKTKMAIPLSVLVVMPIFLIVILIIGCVWWREAENRKEQRKEASLVKPKSVHSLPVEKQPLIIPEILIKPGSSEDSIKVRSASGSKTYIHEESPFNSKHSIQSSLQKINTPVESVESIHEAKLKESSSNKFVESSMNKSADEIDMKKEQSSSKGSIIEKGWVNLEADAPLKI